MARQPFILASFPEATDVPTLSVALGRLFQKLQRAIPSGPSTQTLTASTTLPDGLQTEHVLYRCDATGGPFTVTLPKSVTSADTVLTLKRINSGANAVTWTCQGSDTVDGATTGTLATQYAVLRLYARSGGYDVL